MSFHRSPVNRCRPRSAEDNLLRSQRLWTHQVWSLYRRNHCEKIYWNSLCICWSSTLKLLNLNTPGETRRRVFDLQGKTQCADGPLCSSWRLLDRMGADEAELSRAVWTRPLWSPWCRRWWGRAGIGAEAPVDLFQIDFRQLETRLDVIDRSCFESTWSGCKKKCVLLKVSVCVTEICDENMHT